MDLYGPALPPGYVKPKDDEEEEFTINDTKSKTGKVIGPLQPEFLSEESESENKILESVSFTTASSIGPQLPPHLRNETDPDFISENICGPALAEFGEVDNVYERKAEIEKRAKQMRDKLNNKDIPVKVSEREEWMVVPDTSRRNQLGAISRCLAPSKSSSKKQSHSHHHSEKDEKTSEELKKYNKKRRSESLMDVHAKKLKKKEKEKKSKEKKERKAFDREEMGTRHFTKEQVNSVIDKAKFLNSRFAAGSSKFL